MFSSGVSVLVCPYIFPQLSLHPALIRVFILPWVCQQARRDAAADPSCAFPSRMPMADKSPTSSGECKPLFHPPPLYRPSVFLVECSFPFHFFFSLKAEKEIPASDYDLSVLIFVFSLFLVLFVGCSDWAKKWDLFTVEFPLLKPLLLKQLILSSEFKQTLWQAKVKIYDTLNIKYVAFITFMFSNLVLQIVHWLWHE